MCEVHAKECKCGARLPVNGNPDGWCCSNWPACKHKK